MSASCHAPAWYMSIVDCAIEKVKMAGMSTCSEKSSSPRSTEAPSEMWPERKKPTCHIWGGGRRVRRG
eukprot:6365823-Prymnesium_polylepis.1